MQEKKLNIIDSSISFLAGFLLSQLAVVFVMIIGYFVCIFSKIDIEMLQPFLNTSIGYLICVIAMDLVMFLVFWFFKLRSNIKVVTKPKIKKIFLYVLLAVLSFFLLYPIVTCFDTLLFNLGVELNSIPYELNTKNYFISLISLVILPAICEELLFRGIIFNGLKQHGKFFSIVVTSLMFALYHMSVSQTIYPMLFGLLLGVIMYYENNIIYCITAHMTNNFLSLTLSYLNVNLSYNHWSYILIAIVFVAIFICLVLYFTIKNNKNEKKEKINKVGAITLSTSIIIMVVIWLLNNLMT